MDSIDCPVLIALRFTAAELQSKKLNLFLALKKHEMEFKITPTRSISHSSESSQAPNQNIRPLSV